MDSSGASHLLWLVIAVACQFLWGTYPAAVRYMQTKAQQPLTSLQLSLLINLLACPALFFGNTLPLWLAAVHRQYKQKRQERGAPTKPPAAHAWDSATTEPLLGPDEDGRVDVETAAAPSAAPADGDAGAAPVPQQPAKQGSSWKRQAKVLLLTTIFLSTLFLSQVFSLLFTTAYLSQMVFLLAPVIVAFMAKILYKSPLPPGLWPALGLMLLGCGMVIGSKAMAAGKPPKNAVDGLAPLPSSAQVGLWAGRAEEAWLCTAVFGDEHGSRLCGLDDGDEEGEAHPWVAAVTEASNQGVGKKKKKRPTGSLGMHDVLGIGLSFLGAVCLAAFMTVVQRSGGVVSDQQVLWANFLTQAPICLALTFAFERDRFHILLHLSPLELGEVFAMAAGVNWFANWVQQMCIRKLGAPQAAAFLPVRLLGSLAASYPLLNEGLVGPLQWGGAGLLMLAVTWYLNQQRKTAAGGSRSTADLLHTEATAPVYVA